MGPTPPVPTKSGDWNSIQLKHSVRQARAGYRLWGIFYNAWTSRIRFMWVLWSEGVPWLHRRQTRSVLIEGAKPRLHIFTSALIIFWNSTHLLIRLGQADGAVKFVCAECGLTYAKAASLKAHLASHTAELAFRCAHCGRRFKLESQRLAHIRQLHQAARRSSIGADGDGTPIPTTAAPKAKAETQIIDPTAS